MASKNPLLRDNLEIVLHILTIMETIYCNPGVDSKDIMGWKSCDLGITLREKVKIHVYFSLVTVTGWHVTWKAWSRLQVVLSCKNAKIHMAWHGSYYSFTCEVRGLVRLYIGLVTWQRSHLNINILDGHSADRVHTIDVMVSHRRHHVLAHISVSSN